MKDFLCKIAPFFCIGWIVFLCVFIPYDAYKTDNDDYEKHKPFIGKELLLNNDTVKILEWRVGRFDKIRGYVLSNGMTVDELVVYNAKILNNN